MINNVNSIAGADLMNTVRQITQTRQAMEGVEVKGISKITGSEEVNKTPSFGDMLSNLVKSVDTKSKESQAAAEAVMTGKSDNIHQAMLSMQESSVAFTMMSEVRNKLVSAYQELMRMQV